MFKITARLLITSTIFIISIYVVTPAFAASLNLSDANTTEINNPNQEFQLKVDFTIDNSDGNVYYLRGVFYKSGSSNYCGITWNGSSWFSGPYTSADGWKNFIPITIASSSASTILKAKLDPSDSGCRDNGNYNFKVQRFTEGGSSNFDTQNEQSLTVNFPTSTPTPTSVPTSIPTSSPTNTSVPTASPKPQSTPTKYISPTIKKILPTITDTVNNSEGTVLGEVSNPTLTPEEIIPTLVTDTKTSTFPVFGLLLGGGILFLAAAVVVSVRQIKSNQKLN